MERVLAVAEAELARPGPWRVRRDASIRAQIATLAAEPELLETIIAAVRSNDRELLVAGDDAMERWATMLGDACGSDERPALRFELLCGALVHRLHTRLADGGRIEAPDKLSQELCQLLDAFEPPAVAARG
jgi:hypothetical protein